MRGVLPELVAVAPVTAVCAAAGITRIEIRKTPRTNAGNRINPSLESERPAKPNPCASSRSTSARDAQRISLAKLEELRKRRRLPNFPDSPGEMAERLKAPVC